MYHVFLYVPRFVVALDVMKSVSIHAGGGAAALPAGSVVTGSNSQGVFIAGSGMAGVPLTHPTAPIAAAAAPPTTAISRQVSQSHPSALLFSFFRIARDLPTRTFSLLSSHLAFFRWSHSSMLMPLM